MRAFMLLLLAASPVLADPVEDCMRAMALRPMPPPLTAGDALGQISARQAAKELCRSDPYAHLKPLPWEAATRPPPQPMCYIQPLPGGGSQVMCL